MRTTKSCVWARKLLLAVAASLIVAPCALAEDPTGGEIGLLAGFVFPDTELSGESERFDSLGDDPTAGIRLGAVFSERWGWFIDGLYADIDSIKPAGSAESIAGRTGLEFRFNPEKEWRWFLNGAGGWLNLDFDKAADFDSAFASVGFGQHGIIGDRANFRWELRADRTLDDRGLNGEDLTQGRVLFGVSWGPGTAQDTDRDGVTDRRDACPGTPAGAHVDIRGCPFDGDEDGAYDGLDRCPGTPPRWPVDANGCPRDSDGDGVPDGQDTCPETPRGAVVDNQGCPRDGDSDGVLDGLDSCPDTPLGARVDASGCPQDGDGDGVLDGLDRCPETPAGARVDATGCVPDSDGDGVPDNRDRCPGTPGGTRVDANGCPLAAPLFEDERQTLILEGVNFENDAAELTSESVMVLDRVAASLRDWPGVTVEIGGHTDSRGADGYNLELSRRRAETVRRYLIGAGVQPDRLVAQGYGETRPIADNETRPGRARNRRVEMKKLN